MASSEAKSLKAMNLFFLSRSFKDQFPSSPSRLAAADNHGPEGSSLTSIKEEELLA
jgi:hypothetical protein